MQPPTVGRIVHYVLERPEPRPPIVRPAIIVHVWPGTTTQDGLVQLQVFTDCSNDGFATGTAWKTSVLYDEEKKPGTWHWPPRA